MNIIRHLYLSTALRAPDDDIAAPDALVETSVAEPVAAAEPQIVEPAPAPEPVAAPAPPMVPLRVLQQRIGEESGKRQAIERRAAEAETRAAELQSIVDRLQAQQQADPNAQPQQPAQRQAPQEQPNLEDAVRRVVDQRESARSISDVIQRGVQEYTQAQWDEKASILGALGAASPEFVQDVIAVDAANAHKIIFALAEDPGKAADLASMNVRQRTAELTRMSMAEQAKTPTNQAAPAAPAAAKTPISKAPAPATIPRAHAEAGEVDPTTPEGNEKMSDEQWGKWFKAEGAKKLYRTA